MKEVTASSKSDPFSDILQGLDNAIHALCQVRSAIQSAQGLNGKSSSSSIPPSVRQWPNHQAEIAAFILSEFPNGKANGHSWEQYYGDIEQRAQNAVPKITTSRSTIRRVVTAMREDLAQ